MIVSWSTANRPLMLTPSPSMIIQLPHGLSSGRRCAFFLDAGEPDAPTSRAKGPHRKLGGLVSGRQMLRERDGPHREGEEP
jgi:hypothetical protein